MCVCENCFWIETQMDDKRVEWAFKTAVMLPRLPKQGFPSPCRLHFEGGQLFPGTI